jgi:hypothetical protein
MPPGRSAGTVRRVFTLQEPPLFTRLRGRERVLVAGAGGGFDVYAGLPLALALLDAGVTVHLANVSFVTVDALPAAARLRPGLAAVTPGLAGNDGYFPERGLATWLEKEGYEPVVHAIARSGVPQVRACFRELVRRLDLDAVAHARAGTARPSIVNESVAAALRGEFGDVPVDARTAGGELFVNPLMAVYLAFDLAGLARHVRYLDRLEGTRSLSDVAARIEEFREEITHRRQWRAYPHREPPRDPRGARGPRTWSPASAAGPPAGAVAHLARRAGRGGL